MAVTILGVLLLFGVVAMLGKNGLWNNGVLLINVVLSLLMSMAMYPILTELFISKVAVRLVFFYPLLFMLLLFSICLSLSRLLSRLASKIQVRFHPVMDAVGSYVCTAIISWLMLGFILAAMHYTPMPEKYLWDSFFSNGRMMFGIAPDRQFLGFVKMQSRGTFHKKASNPFEPDAYISSGLNRRSIFKENKGELLLDKGAIFSD